MAQETSLRCELMQSVNALEDARESLSVLPTRVERQVDALPQTFTEATHYVQAKEDERRRKEAKKEKSKQKGVPAFDDDIPGLVPKPPSTSVFWLLSEGWFRDVTREDVADLLPGFANPLADPVHCTPPLGHLHHAPDDADGTPRLATTPMHSLSWQPQQALLKDRVSELKAQAATEAPHTPEAESTTTAEGLSAEDTSRKSRRLVAKAVRQAESSREADLSDFMQPDAEEALPAGVSLVEQCSPLELSVLVKQVLALQPASIEETELRNCDAAASTSWLAACAADGPAEQASAPLESHTAEAHRWLAKQAAHMLSQDNGQPLPAADRKEDVHHPVAHGNGHALEQGLASVDDKKGGTNTALRADSSGAGVNQEDVNGRAQATDGAQGSGAPAVADAASWLFPGLITGLQPSEAAGLLTWTAWQAALTGARPSALSGAADDEALHPYTALLLEQPPGHNVTSPEQDLRRFVGYSAPGTPSAVTPSASAEDGSALTASVRGHAADAGADSAHSAGPVNPAKPFHAHPSALARAGSAPDAAAAHAEPEQAPSAREPAGAAEEQALGTPATAAREDVVGALQLAERVASGSLAGPSREPHAGNEGAPARQRGHQGAAHGGRRAHGKSGGGERGEGRHRSQTALAVQAAVAAGAAEGPAMQQWQQLADAGELLAAAPDDEIAAEMLALQAELMQQEAVNLARVRAVLERVLPDVPRQREEAAERQASMDALKDYFTRVRVARRGQKKEKREAAARDALADAAASLQQSPRPAPGRPPRAGMPTKEPTQVPMVDLLASRSEEEEALCAVCGGGVSVAPNFIVFCERCDVAVHQACYQIDEVPSGEWLCWPCAAHEDALRAAGVDQKDIRPPRWELSSGPGGRRTLEGGSLAAECALCPVRCGAFRQTVDTQEWVHQVCAQWVPGVRVARLGACAVVEGVAGLPQERWGVPCSLCGSSMGVVLRCNAGHCSLPFHALCARNAGLYLAVRGDPGKPASSYRAYCAQHSAAQRRKDAEVSGEGAQGAAQRKAEEKRREREQAALRALASKEGALEALTAARLELEALRLLLERIGRRERIKAQLARASQELFRLRSRNPASALALLRAAEAGPSLRERVAAREQQAGMPGGALLVPPPAAVQPAVAPAVATAGTDPPAAVAATPVSSAPGPTAAAGAEAQAAPAPKAEPNAAVPAQSETPAAVERSPQAVSLPEALPADAPGAVPPAADANLAAVPQPPAAKPAPDEPGAAQPAAVDTEDPPGQAKDTGQAVQSDSAAAKEPQEARPGSGRKKGGAKRAGSQPKSKAKGKRGADALERQQPQQTAPAETAVEETVEDDSSRGKRARLRRGGEAPQRKSTRPGSASGSQQQPR